MKSHKLASTKAPTDTYLEIVANACNLFQNKKRDKAIALLNTMPFECRGLQKVFVFMNAIIGKQVKTFEDMEAGLSRLLQTDATIYSEQLTIEKQQRVLNELKSFRIIEDGLPTYITESFKDYLKSQLMQHLNNIYFLQQMIANIDPEETTQIFSTVTVGFAVDVLGIEDFFTGYKNACKKSQKVHTSLIRNQIASDEEQKKASSQILAKETPVVSTLAVTTPVAITPVTTTPMANIDTGLKAKSTLNPNAEVFTPSSTDTETMVEPYDSYEKYEAEEPYESKHETPDEVVALDNESSNPYFVPKDMQPHLRFPASLGLPQCHENTAYPPAKPKRTSSFTPYCVFWGAEPHLIEQEEVASFVPDCN